MLNKFWDIFKNHWHTEYSQTSKTDTADTESAFSLPKNSLETQAEKVSKLSVENNSSFKKGLEKFKSGQYSQNDDLVILESTPQYLYNLGLDESKPIAINMSKLKTVMAEPKGRFNGKNQHGITWDIIEQLPNALQKPLNVLKNPNQNNKLVVITELTDQYGDIVIAPIEMNSDGYIDNFRTNLNRADTIYGKENYDIPKKGNQVGYAEYNKNNIVYDIDKDITQKRNTNSGYRLQSPSSTTDVLTDSITPNESSVNTEYSLDSRNIFEMW